MSYFFIVGAVITVLTLLFDKKAMRLEKRYKKILGM